jgi:hypothetical protein
MNKIKMNFENIKLITKENQMYLMKSLFHKISLCCSYVDIFDKKEVIDVVKMKEYILGILKQIDQINEEYKK